MADVVRKIQLRRDLASTWWKTNPTLAAGELGFELDTRKVKIGDGQTPWNGLNYISTSQSGDVVMANFPPALELELEWAQSSPDSYTELSYVADHLQSIDIYTNSSKSQKLFQKVFLYDSTPKLTQIQTTRSATGAKLTRVIGYDSNGNVKSVTRTYTGI